eukprot:1984787-Pleurochrysis_carterae.AAC.1
MVHDLIARASYNAKGELRASSLEAAIGNGPCGSSPSPSRRGPCQPEASASPSAAWQRPGRHAGPRRSSPWTPY